MYNVKTMRLKKKSLKNFRYFFKNIYGNCLIIKQVGAFMWLSIEDKTLQVGLRLTCRVLSTMLNG